MTASATYTLPEACELLGISPWAGYRLVKAGEFPAPVLKLGRTLRIPRQPLHDALGIEAG